MSKTRLGRRMRLKPGMQATLVQAVKKQTKFHWAKLSKLLGVSDFTLRCDWGYERTTIPEPCFLKLISFLPKGQQARFNAALLETLDQNWGQRKGVEISLQAQGVTRIGKISREMLASPDFAEFIGIVLGDGHVSRKSIAIAFNNKCEQEYANYVCSLVENLFGKRPLQSVKNGGSVRYVLTNSTELVSFLVAHGIPLGSRKNRAIGALGIFGKNKTLLRRFVRGLVDTDGGVFRKSRKDMRLLIEFKSFNKSLLDSFVRAVKLLGFHPSKSGKNAARIQLQEEVHRYAREVGFSNHKNLLRYSQWAH